MSRSAVCAHLTHVHEVEPRTPEGCEDASRWAMTGSTSGCA